MGAGKLHIQVGIADLLTDHLAHTQRAEHRVGHHEGDLPAGGKARGQTGAVLRGKGDEAGLGKPRGDAEHILLGNAHVDILPGQLLAEITGLAALADVDIHDQQVGIFLAQCYDLVAEAVAGGDILLFAHFMSLLA